MAIRRTFDDRNIYKQQNRDVRVIQYDIRDLFLRKIVKRLNSLEFFRHEIR